MGLVMASLVAPPSTTGGELIVLWVAARMVVVVPFFPREIHVDSFCVGERLGDAAILVRGIATPAAFHSYVAVIEVLTEGLEEGLALIIVRNVDDGGGRFRVLHDLYPFEVFRHNLAHCAL